MIEFYKKRGETPLQALDRLRIEHVGMDEQTLSYAGRLDPMAEGILTVLVGQEENKNRKEFLEKDKEYEAHFLIGCSTDTGDVLGMIQEINFIDVSRDTLVQIINSFTQIIEQTYPWYSSKTVEGIPLFEYARAGKFDIKRPVRNITIYSVSDIRFYEADIAEIIQQNIKDIEGVIGDFRQKEIIGSWREVMGYAGQAKPAQYVLLASCILRVSSGTYIRALCEYIQQSLGVPVVLQKLVRTKVF